MSSTLAAAPVSGRVFHAEDDLSRSLPVAGGIVEIVSVRSPDRTENQDACGVVPLADGSAVLVVADGVGGERSGAVASRTAVEALVSSLVAPPGENGGLRAAILDGIERANRAIAGLGTGAATTVAVMGIHEGRVRPFHVGDSVILVTGQRGKIKHQNIAHGPVGYALEAGLIDEGEAMHHEERNVVSNVVGSTEMRIEIGPSLALARHDTVLLASDGLSDNMYVAEIIEAVRKGPLGESIRILRETCRNRMLDPVRGQPSKADDLTFLLYRPSELGGGTPHE